MYYNGSCHGINCCRTSIPSSLNYLNTSFRDIVDPVNDRNKCKYAFMVDAEWFDSDVMSLNDVQKLEYVPAVLDWGTNGSTADSSVGSLCSSNASCLNISSIYHCSCNDGYDGNPYLPHGCEDINECLDSKLNNCQKICINTLGSYECSCPDGYYLYHKHKCYKQDDSGTRSQVAITGIVFTYLVIAILLLGTWWLWKIVKRRKKTKLKEKLFKRNGGLLLQQQLSSSSEGNVEKTKVFTSKELEKATDHYNVNRILGQGGQGTVYKGMLTDGRIVAVKKSKIQDKGKLQHFINEVVILSQINHRNVVKLLGCCLETEVPLLVYEFIPNGTLSQHIHDQNDEFPLSWDMRLQIGTEVAGALSYLHSAASLPIYHRDVKSTNILLDDKYRAKVADFGTSRSINIDQTHLTTRVLGTFGYLDPEYFRSSQFTEKSDVYSFGVVLVELLTGEKVISSTRCEEERSLVTYFISTMKNNCLYDILDTRVMEEGVKEEMMAVANLAKRCLNLNGRKRPTMKEVAMELEGIRTSHGATISQQNYEEIECSSVAEQVEPWDVDVDLASTSTSSCSDHI
ncbi:hypothetical protein F0562_007752 [Nyssa sinensis]|uniref:Protein kinase domain-containing protein n=1 Tax=Nyssa sinensis TaxID=561372 RepID=A0A5J5A7Y8_9ASTE|nr:hypothetical protein F0562_007752 [Nyssa sinensis]